MLPDGVFLILSQRPIPDKCHFDEASPHRETLDAASDENKADLKAYLTAVAHRPEIAGQIKAQGYSEAQFIETLAEKSGGVWMYLYYIISEISSGNRAPLDLRTLPNGLAGYYEQFWRKWRDNPDGKWDKFYAPLLATLAAARDFIPLDWLMTWSGVAENKHAVKRLLDENWKAFIKQDSQKRYALYHASLRDFLTADTSRLSGLSGLAEEMGERTREAHRRIVEQLRARCGGEWVKLIDDDYARRNLCTHLNGAGLQVEMFSLVAESDAWAKVRYEKEESYAEYLTDLALAWAWTDNERGWDVGQQIRCALIESTIHTLAGNISPELLARLVEIGMWSKARALSHIPQMPIQLIQAEAIGRLAPYLLSDSLKSEALRAARAIKDDSARARALAYLAPYLPNDLKADVYSEVLQAMYAIKDDRTRASTRANPAPLLLPNRVKTHALVDALQAARAINDDYSCVGAFVNLTPHLPDDLKAHALADALQAARAIKDEYSRTGALVNLTPHLPDDLKAHALSDALQSARAINDEYSRASALASLAPHLPDDLKAHALSEALQAARALKDNHTRAPALANLAPYLPDDLKINVLCDALQATLTIKDDFFRTGALASLAPHLPDDLKPDALQAAHAIKDNFFRVDALTNLVPHLPNDLKPDLLRDALQAALAIKSNVFRAGALTNLAPHLPDDLKTHTLSNALQAAGLVENQFDRARSLIILAPLLPDDLKTHALSNALQAARLVKNQFDCARALVSLAPLLPDDLKPNALQVARAIKNDSARASALASLVLYSESELQCVLLPEIFPSVKLIRGRYELQESDAVYLQTSQLWARLGYIGLRVREMWPDTLHLLSEKERSELLYNLSALLPLIEHIGGQKAVVEMYKAVRDVTQWWP